MNEEEVRAMIRDSIARRLAPGAPSAGEAPGGLSFAGHASFVRLPLASGGDGDGMCIIEPGVRCTHCGYCQSFGH
jgi:hypothetical protein